MNKIKALKSYTIYTLLCVVAKIIISITYLTILMLEVITIAPIIVMLIEESVYKDDKTLLKHQINMICGNYT